MTTAQDTRSTRLPPSMLTSDPPEHNRLRAIGARLISPASVQALRPLVDADVAAMLGGAGANFEAYDDVGLPLAVLVLARLIDVPADEHAQFRQLAEAASVTLDPMSAGPQGARAAATLAFYLRARLAVSAALQEWTATAGCSDAEAVGVLSLCVVGGLEPLAVLIAAALLHAATSPDTQCEDAADEVEQLLRDSTPIPIVARAARTDVTLPSGMVPAGRRVLALLDAANHDASSAAPGVGDRQATRHLSFGAGPHFCLGAPLVRAVLSAVLLGCAARPLTAVDEPRAWAPTLIPRRLRPIHLRRR